MRWAAALPRTCRGTPQGPAQGPLLFQGTLTQLLLLLHMGLNERSNPSFGLLAVCSAASTDVEDLWR